MQHPAAATSLSARHPSESSVTPPPPAHRPRSLTPPWCFCIFASCAVLCSAFAFLSVRTAGSHRHTDPSARPPARMPVCKHSPTQHSSTPRPSKSTSMREQSASTGVESACTWRWLIPTPPQRRHTGRPAPSAGEQQQAPTAHLLRARLQELGPPHQAVEPLDRVDAAEQGRRLMGRQVQRVDLRCIALRCSSRRRWCSLRPQAKKARTACEHHLPC